MANNAVELVDDVEETEETEVDLTPEKMSQAVVHGTDWTVETVLSQLRRKNIDMPPFQRRDAWTRRRKSRYNRRSWVWKNYNNESNFRYSF